MFASEVLDRGIDLGVPSRLPAASRPNPKPACRGARSEISERIPKRGGKSHNSDTIEQLWSYENTFDFSGGGGLGNYRNNFSRGASP